MFRVEPSYLLLDRGEAPFDSEIVEALRDKTAQEPTREVSHPSGREKRLVLGISAESPSSTV